MGEIKRKRKRKLEKREKRKRKRGRHFSAELYRLDFELISMISGLILVLFRFIDGFIFSRSLPVTVFRLPFSRSFYGHHFFRSFCGYFESELNLYDYLFVCLRVQLLLFVYFKSFRRHQSNFDPLLFPLSLSFNRERERKREFESSSSLTFHSGLSIKS